MKAKKIWIAEHPTQPGNREVELNEPRKSGTFISSCYHSEDGEWVKWQEYVCIPVESLWRVRR